MNSFSQFTSSMQALSVASKIYRVLPNATFSIEMLNKPISATKWALKSLTCPVSRNIALACVAYMEPRFDIDPDLLSGVLALAFENSLYIAMALVCDPMQQPKPYELKRILGNVGRPGITMLVSPKDCITRSKDPLAWSVVTNHAFNGVAEDHFGKTSLHLSFTEYYVPLIQNVVHGQDNQVFFLESVVSVHDSGAWVGDVNILDALEGGKIRVVLRTMNRPLKLAIIVTRNPRVILKA
ncbi:hypothetical protein OCU04_003384 [Sclerotinia nivalis]|uniref:Uncharacterized protein n=1 Tax=Sclerotinia nivalis TaxID=352851 RepID=A0A9X0DLA6_9HELO|nr:hypothetical protein OCU04_003384 [Sclerotinia nivalis]